MSTHKNCPKCDHPAYKVSGIADEPETLTFRCRHCYHTFGIDELDPDRGLTESERQYLEALQELEDSREDEEALQELEDSREDEEDPEEDPEEDEEDEEDDELG